MNILKKTKPNNKTNNNNKTLAPKQNNNKPKQTDKQMQLKDAYSKV